MFDFTAKLIETGQYNTNNGLVTIAPIGADAEFIGHHIALSNTDILAIPDIDPHCVLTIAHDEIAYVIDEFSGGVINFSSAEDLRRRFHDSFVSMVSVQAGQKIDDRFDGLRTDVLRTLERLRSVFNLKNPLMFRMLCASASGLEMHIDAPSNDTNPRGTIRAVRPLSDLGTIFNIKGVDGFVHAGSALTLIKGDVRHSPHPSEFWRCVYTIDGTPVIS